jgi:tRNA modification GTPase
VKRGVVVYNLELLMNTFAAVMTGKGTGAISTVQVFGDSAEDVVKKIFKPAGTKPDEFKTGEILLGTITDGFETIDQVTIGCEQANSFAINCHGNPLIVADIMQLLQRCGAKLLTAEQLLTKILSAQKSVNTIAVEAKLAQLKAKTIEGTKIITNQIDAGLSKKAAEWLQNINAISLYQISAEAERILENSRPAKLIIAGCTAALIGPPNSGKSTLLNHLAGRQKAIVTDIKGTTRDWVEAVCQIESLSLRLGWMNPAPPRGWVKNFLHPKILLKKPLRKKVLRF